MRTSSPAPVADARHRTRRLIAGARHRTRRLIDDARWTAAVALLPPRVTAFQLRARRLARRHGDALSLTSVTRPRDLRLLLALARGGTRIVELGTATGWTAISLALADPRRRVVSYDIVARPEPPRYLALVPSSARERIELVIGPGSAGPARDRGGDVDLLYIDSSHERDQTIAEVLAWRPVLRPGARIVFDDYRHPDFPGVRAAITELGLGGVRRGTLFVHTVTDHPPPTDDRLGPAARR